MKGDDDPLQAQEEPSALNRRGFFQVGRTLRDGDGLLLTTIKWASASGKSFLGEDRSHSGVTPSVEVKRPEVLDSVDPEDLTGNDDDAASKPGVANDKRDVSPDAGAKPQVEDVQLKKALELLREKTSNQ